ncbi:hypothetical protein T07_15269 [Trichinella nelsoni]|uniref:Uncharacterized protein n=1 Tax=Trichinella nelsoni TaxID=6336 RepID=A0A0V0S5R2_9BILA|nr:hypothetical protein T07_15269 [Trichinella nelsoni]
MAEQESRGNERHVLVLTDQSKPHIPDVTYSLFSEDVTDVDGDKSERCLLKETSETSMESRVIGDTGKTKKPTDLKKLESLYFTARTHSEGCFHVGVPVHCSVRACNLTLIEDCAHQLSCHGGVIIIAAVFILITLARRFCIAFRKCASVSESVFAMRCTVAKDGFCSAKKSEFT